MAYLDTHSLYLAYALLFSGVVVVVVMGGSDSC
jgi:hypothetical protein